MFLTNRAFPQQGISQKEYNLIKFLTPNEVFVKYETKFNFCNTPLQISWNVMNPPGRDGVRMKKRKFMNYYDTIAKQWHEATGYKGGAFKELVLNAVLLKKLPPIQDRAILELGVGNGYFLPMVFRHFSGQTPSEVVITDQSQRQLDMAQKHFRVSMAIYSRLDVCQRFPFEDNHFDLILASMIFNEVPTRGFQQAFMECYRVLSPEGSFLMTVIHPDFVRSLYKRGMLKHTNAGVLTMPGGGSLRLPVVVRSVESYRNGLKEAGFCFEEEEVYPTAEVVNIKIGLRHAGNVPLALVFKCGRSKSSEI